MQYPCVGGTNLYDPIDPTPKAANNKEAASRRTMQPTDPNQHATGRSLWSLLNYSIFLTKQMRQNDPVYLQMLTDLRLKQTAPSKINEHLNILNPRVLGSPTADSDATCAHFQNAPLITTRNVVRVAVNFQKVKSCVFGSQSRCLSCP